MYALFKKNIRTGLDWWAPAAVTLLSIFSVGMWEGITWNGSVLIGYAIGSLFQTTGVFLLCWLLFFNVWWDFADVPFEKEAFSFFSERSPAVVQGTYRSHLLLVSYRDLGTFWCKRPSLPAMCLSYIEKYFPHIFFFHHWKSLVCDTASS